MESYADVRVDQDGQVLNTKPTDFPAGQLKVAGIDVTAPGPAGMPGKTPALIFAYSNAFSGNPTDGNFRFDNLPGLATQLCIAHFDASGTDIGSFIDSWNIGGLITLGKSDAGTSLAPIFVFKVTGPAIDHVTWSEVPITVVVDGTGSASPWPSMTNIYVVFSPAGTGGGSSEIEFTAAQDIPAFSVVTSTGQVADSSNVVSHYDRVIGVTDTDVLSGFIGQAVATGEITNPAWSWTPGTKLFLNGTTLSATPPSSGFSQFIAVARSAMVIIVRLEVPIRL